MRIIIAGGTGTIGKALSSYLLLQGNEVVVLGRRSGDVKGVQYAHWNVEASQVDSSVFKNGDVLINFTGESVADKAWTVARRKQIKDSRINSTKLLFEACEKEKVKPKLFISASAVGFYGYSENSEKVFSEEETPGDDFLAETCFLWEREAFRFLNLNVRTVVLRFGLVLEKGGGALKKIIPIAKAGILSPLGNGKQIVPWIHIDDICRIVEYAIHFEKVAGALNAVSSEQPTNKTFFQTISKLLKKPFFMPSVPTFVMQILFGKRSEILTKGNYISNSKLLNFGYQFKFHELTTALQNILN